MLHPCCLTIIKLAKYMLSLNEINCINYKCVVELNPNSNHMTSNVRSIEEFSSMDHNKTFMNAIYLDNTPIGFVMVDCENDKLKIKRFMIDASYQQMGFGSHAMTLLLKKAFAIFDNYDNIYVTTRNSKAKKFYEKFGFEPCEHSYICDKQIDEYVLILDKLKWWMNDMD